MTAPTTPAALLRLVDRAERGSMLASEARLLRDGIRELAADLTADEDERAVPPGFRERALAMQDASARRLADDLASLLNRAVELCAVVCPDTSDESTSYSVATTRLSSDVTWDPVMRRWRATYTPSEETAS